MEDEIIYKLRFAKQIYDEFRESSEPQSKGIALVANRFVMCYLVDALPDLVNFDKALFH